MRVPVLISNSLSDSESTMVSFFRCLVRAGEGFEGEAAGDDTGVCTGDETGVLMSEILSRTDTPDVPGRSKGVLLFLGALEILSLRGRGWEVGGGMGRVLEDWERALRSSGPRILEGTGFG